MEQTTFGSRLATARKAADLTQEDLGAAVGVGKGAVSSWEVGRTEPTLEQVAALARLLAISTDALLGSPSKVKRAVAAKASA